MAGPDPRLGAIDSGRPPRIALFANTDWYLYNFRLSLARRLKDLGCEVVLLSPPGDYGERLATLGFHWLPLPMRRRSLNPFTEARLIVQVATILRRERIELVHGFTIKAAVYAALAARLAGIPARVSAITGLGWVFISQEPTARMLRPWVRLMLRIALGGSRARLILQNPDDVEQFSTQRLARRDRIRLIRGSGVDCTRFTPPEQSDVDPRAPFQVLLAARLLWDKGLDDFVDASRRLAAESRKVRMLVAGTPDPGNPASIPPDVVQAWVREGAIEWLGHVEDMPGLLRSVDVVALPSRREGLPRSLIEAAACGRPLIATDVPGCREVVRHGVDGFLVSPGDGAGLAEAIAKLQDDPGLAARMGAAARARAVAEFDQAVVLDATLAVYDELLASGAPRAELGLDAAAN